MKKTIFRENKFSLSIVIGLLFATGMKGQAASSFGPGKGPAIAGSGSKYTYPQPPKPTVYSMKSIRPAYQVPEHPEKYRWVLTSKFDGREPATPTNDVPVYGYLPSGGRVLVGNAKAGEEIILEDMRPVGKAHYYRFPWTGSPNKTQKFGPAPVYWVSGSNIEFAGPK